MVRQCDLLERVDHVGVKLMVVLHSMLYFGTLLVYGIKFLSLQGDIESLRLYILPQVGMLLLCLELLLSLLLH